MAIHRAIYGSLERFIGILVEHFAGAFPLWIAPVQAVVIPIADRHVEPARELAAELRAAGLRFVEVDASDNRMQNKIRLAQGQKVPYMLILGDREVEARTRRAPLATPRSRACLAEGRPPRQEVRSAAGLRTWRRLARTARSAVERRLGRRTRRRAAAQGPGPSQRR